MDSAVASTSVRWRAVGPLGGAIAASSPWEMNAVSSRPGVVRSASSADGSGTGTPQNLPRSDGLAGGFYERAPERSEERCSNGHSPAVMVQQHGGLSHVEPSAAQVTAAIRLTEWTSCGGCAAKWGAAPLGQLVRDLAVSA